MRLPALFIGHGSPMNAIEDTPYSRVWQQLGQQLRRQFGGHIRTILAISAHWLTDGTAVTAMPEPRTIHDFGGFPQALYEATYPAPGNPQLAAHIQQLLSPLPVTANQSWGLDHGTWSILAHLFPEADIPVVQLSLNARYSAQQHIELAQKLAGLREEGVLIIASGNIVHNLRTLDFANLGQPSPGYPWAENIRRTVNQWLADDNLEALGNDDAYPADMRQAAPTPEHFWPLLYIAGVRQEGEQPQLFCDDIIGKSLSMTSVAYGLPANA